LLYSDKKQINHELLEIVTVVLLDYQIDGHAYAGRFEGCGLYSVVMRLMC